MNDTGLFLSRLALGAGIAAHGAQKAFGAFEGPGPKGAAQFMKTLGFVPGERFARAASWTELGSGALMVLGVGGALGPAALISTMVVAQTAVHAKNGFFAQKNGVELGLMYSAGALALASAGYGKFSLDEAFGWEKLKHPWLSALALTGGVAAGLLVLSGRSAVPAETSAAPSANGPATEDGRPESADRSAADGNAALQP